MFLKFFKGLGLQAAWVGQDLTERDHDVFQAQLRFLKAESGHELLFSVFGNFGFGTLDENT